MPWYEVQPEDLVGMLAVGVIAALLVTLEKRARQARRLVFGHAALLVPPVMACAALAILHYQGDTVRFFENPFGLAHFQVDGRMVVPCWLAFGIVALTLAGHAGLLEAVRAGRRPGGQDFLDGMVRHGITIAAGKLLLFGAVYGISTLVDIRSLGLLLFLIPSALLAPLPGFASLHPGNPARAIGATLRFAYDHLQRVGFRVTLQTAFLIVMIGVMCQPFAIHRYGPEMLPLSSSSLSWNTYPFVQIPLPDGFVILCALAAALVSTVFVTAHWLDVVESHEPARRPATAANPT